MEWYLTKEGCVNPAVACFMWTLRMLMLGLVMDDYLQSFEVRLNTSFLLHLLREPLEKSNFIPTEFHWKSKSLLNELHILTAYFGWFMVAISGHNTEHWLVNSALFNSRHERAWMHLYLFLSPTCTLSKTRTRTNSAYAFILASRKKVNPGVGMHLALGFICWWTSPSTSKVGQLGMPCHSHMCY